MTYQSKLSNEYILQSTANCSSKSEDCADEQDIGRVPLPENSVFTWQHFWYFCKVHIKSLLLYLVQGICQEV